MLKVQQNQCATCIYRKDSPLDITALEAQCVDSKCPGHFTSYRVCHHDSANKAVCAGFWARHKDDFDLGQVAQRLQWIEYVDIDDFGPGKGGS